MWGTAPAHHGSGTGWRQISTPLRIRTPLSGVPESSSKISKVLLPQESTRSSGLALYGYQMAAATLDVVPGGNSAATIPASTPASRRQIAAVSPITPHPTTTASAPARVSSSSYTLYDLASPSATSSGTRV